MITTKYGLLSGIENPGYTVYKGVPFAMPPTGDLRWRAPRPPLPWEGVLKAEKFGGRSLQRPRQPGSFYDKEFGGGEEDETPLSEDCLYLNLWVPEGAEAGKSNLPVAVYIHGGAFLGGSGYEKEFDGKGFAARGVILITINYRLGVWGYFAHPLLSRESETGTSGNYGLLDQIAALRWVRENIAAFGGDPDNVTVFGQSAGAMSVMSLLCCDAAKGLMHKAVIQSGLGLGSTRPLADAEADGEALSAALGITDVEALRATDADAIAMASGPLIMRGFKSGPMPYMPVVDGVLLKGDHWDILNGKAQHPIPLMVGSNRNDMITTPENLAKGIPGPMYDAVTDFTALVSPVQPVYPYYFTRALPGDDAGAFHSAELWYVFGSLEHCWRPMTAEDRALSEKMIGYWSDFMKTGNPNGGNRLRWNPGERMILDIS